jgi:hypothetical protein
MRYAEKGESLVISSIDECRNYIVEIQITKECVSIRDRNYPINSCNPSSEGRYHRVGEPAYYFASGESISKVEVYGDASADLDENDVICHMPLGNHLLFDSRSYFRDHPEEREYYCGPRDTGSWHNCQELRAMLGNNNVSGIVYCSNQVPGGVNIAVWPLTSDTLPVSYFRIEGFG